MTQASFWNQVFIWPILNLLLAFYKGFAALGLPGSLGLAIIALTIFIRFLIYPLTAAQLKSAKKMADLKPHLDALKDKHGHDRQKLAQAQMDLYKQHGVNPAAGCLPLILQMPFFYALFQVFQILLDQKDLTSVVDQVNKVVYFPFLRIEGVPDTVFLGINLAAKPSQWQTFGWFLLLIPVVTGLLMLVQSLMMLPASQKPSSAPPAGRASAGKGGSEEMAQTVQTQMTYLMPVMFGLFSFNFSSGLSLYWNTFTLFGIIQQAKISGWGRLAKYLKK